MEGAGRVRGGERKAKKKQLIWSLPWAKVLHGTGDCLGTMQDLSQSSSSQGTRLGCLQPPTPQGGSPRVCEDRSLDSGQCPHGADSGFRFPDRRHTGREMVPAPVVRGRVVSHSCAEVSGARGCLPTPTPRNVGGVEARGGCTPRREVFYLPPGSVMEGGG